jgi:hypothetical protein
MWRGDYLFTREDHDPLPLSPRGSWLSALARLSERLLCALFGAR